MLVYSITESRCLNNKAFHDAFDLFKSLYNSIKDSSGKLLCQTFLKVLYSLTGLLCALCGLLAFFLSLLEAFSKTLREPLTKALKETLYLFYGSLKGIFHLTRSLFGLVRHIAHRAVKFTMICLYSDFYRAI